MAAKEIKLNLGCELNAPAGWVNIDGSWGAWLAKHRHLRRLLQRFQLFPEHVVNKPWASDVLVLDVRQPLPFADQVVSVVYASHLLEHLYLEEARSLLQECRRVLRPGGILRLVVPDLRAMIDEYLNQGVPLGKGEGEIGLTPADLLNQRLLLREKSPPAGSIIYKIYSILTDFHSHKWMYDAESLVWHVQQAGYSEVAARPVHDSRIEDIAEVELMERVVHGAGICVEGIKPAR